MNEEELAKYKGFLDDVYKNINPKLLANKSELFKDYYRFVKKCSKVVKEVSIKNNPLSYGFAMSALLADGYFSDSDIFRYDDKDDDDLCKSGLCVLTGSGCCRHVADFLSDIYYELEINSILFSCVRCKKPVNNDLLGKGNHLANLIYYDGIPYVYDGLDYSIFKFIDTKNAKVMNNKFNRRYISFRPRYLAMFYGVSEEVINQLISDFYDASCRNGISKNELREIEFETITHIKEDTIKEFRENTKILKKKISNGMLYHHS